MNLKYVKLTIRIWIDAFSLIFLICGKNGDMLLLISINHREIMKGNLKYQPPKVILPLSPPKVILPLSPPNLDLDSDSDC